MPKARKPSAVDSYPGLKEFATRLYQNTPAAHHGSLRTQLNYFVNQARQTGDATQMNWANQSMVSLQAKFGLPPGLSSPALTVSAPQPAISPKLSAANGTSAESAAIMPTQAATNTQNHKPNKNALKGPVKQQRDHQVSVNGAKSTIASDRNQRQSAAERRRARFQSPSVADAPYMDLKTNGPVVGTSQNLEKSYFRLTGQVNENVVRPPDVLERALAFVFDKYEQNRTNYAYISDQLKSIRQDLTVQHIVTSLTVRVYEINARVSIEHDDMGEYNKCSTQLQSLYALARGVTDVEEASAMLQNEAEFQAYVIYYKLYVGAWEELSLLLRDLNTSTGSSPAARPGTLYEDPGKILRRALRCMELVATGQRLALFHEWRQASPLESKLIGKFAVREQLRSLEAMTRGTIQQSQSLALAFLSPGLGFSEIEELKTFLDSWKVPHDGNVLESALALPKIVEAVTSVSGPADIKGQI